MSAPPISASDRVSDRASSLRAREERAAAAAGWSKADLAWERMQEDAAAACAEGRTRDAIRLWRRARALAFFRLSRRDPRYATGLANAALAARLSGRERSARRLYAQALRLWRRVPTTVATLEPGPRARSSLFHLRMEARHRDTYLDNLRRRMAGFAAETEAVLAALAEDRAPPHALTRRWRGEKPPVFDDVRKFMAAALLIATPPA